MSETPEILNDSASIKLACRIASQKAIDWAVEINPHIKPTEVRFKSATFKLDGGDFYLERRWRDKAAKDDYYAFTGALLGDRITGTSEQDFGQIKEALLENLGHLPKPKTVVLRGAEGRTIVVNEPPLE